MCFRKLCRRIWSTRTTTVARQRSVRLKSADIASAYAASAAGRKRPVRTAREWRPMPLLCKRLDVMDPYRGKKAPLEVAAPKQVPPICSDATRQSHALLPNTECMYLFSTSLKATQTTATTSTHVSVPVSTTGSVIAYEFPGCPPHWCGPAAHV
jgi:hypothetical protein